MASTFIDNPRSLIVLLDSIKSIPTSPPSLFVDLEGQKLSRHGTISILQLYIHPLHHVYLIDVHTLGVPAFTTIGSSGQTLKSILESPSIPKVFFDVRNDSDALYAHFGISLQGVQDIQLMENADRPGHISGKRCLNGLAKCIERDAPLTAQEKQRWNMIKDKGASLFDPAKGGSYQVFDTRPLNEDIRRYCVSDVQYMPQLRSVYWARLTLEWKDKVEVETRARVTLSQSAGYQPHGQHKALGPWHKIPANKPIEDFDPFMPFGDTDEIEQANEDILFDFLYGEA